MEKNKIEKKQDLGKRGEKLAKDYLEKQGYKIVAQNFRCLQGEIDIIAEENEELVFIEVKTRSTLWYGTPAEAVDKPKQKHMIKAAKYYLYRTNQETRYTRFDVIEIVSKQEKLKIHHIKQIL